MSDYTEKPLAVPTPLQQLHGLAIEEYFVKCTHEIHCDCYEYRQLGRRASLAELMTVRQLRLLDDIWASIQRQGGV